MRLKTQVSPHCGFPIILRARSWRQRRCRSASRCSAHLRKQRRRSGLVSWWQTLVPDTLRYSRIRLQPRKTSRAVDSSSVLGRGHHRRALSRVNFMPSRCRYQPRWRRGMHVSRKPSTSSRRCGVKVEMRSLRRFLSRAYDHRSSSESILKHFHVWQLVGQTE